VSAGRHVAAGLLQKLPYRSSLRGESQANGHETTEVVAEKKLAYDPLYFGLVIDAGSSGTRLRMFKWTLRAKVDLAELMPMDGDEGLFEVNPGLDAYADDPEAALPPLLAILKAAQRYVPKAVWDESVLFLKATAGMRLLERSKADQLMTTVREFLGNPDNCPFKFVSAEVISGEEEAVFSFLTTNYNLGTLSTPKKTAGALEMGGASAQVVFRPSSNVQDHEFQFYLDRQRQSVYAKSYLRFGIDDALARTMSVLVRRSPGKDEVESPCHNKGFKGELKLASGKKHKFVGIGNSSACSEVVQKVMGLDIECLMPPCAIFGSYMPAVEGEFYAFAGFFYAANGLGLLGWKDSKALTSEEIAGATDSYCAKDMQTAQQDSGKPMKYAQNYCFMGSYVAQSLEVFGFKNSKSPVIFARKLAGFNLGWPAGAMLYETHLMPLSLKSNEGARDLCGPAAQFGTPSDAKGGAHSPRIGMMGIVVAFFSLGMFF